MKFYLFHMFLSDLEYSEKEVSCSEFGNGWKLHELVVRDCWITLKWLEHWLPFNQKMIHQILHENFGQRRSLWSLFHMMSLMSSLCHDDFIMASDGMMEISHPPYSVKDWTGKVNAAPLDVVSDYFVQLLEMCKKWVAVKEIIVKRIKQFSSDFMCVCNHSISPGTVLFDHILWCWQGQQPYQRHRKNGTCCLYKLKANVAGVHIHIYIHAWVRTYMRACVHTYIIHTCMCACVRAYIHTYINSYIYTYIHTWINNCVIKW